MPYIRAAARWYYSAGATTLSHDHFPALVCRGLMSSGIADRFVTDCMPRCQGSCSDVVTAWFTPNLENLGKNHSGKLLENSWKNDLTLEK